MTITSRLSEILVKTHFEDVPPAALEIASHVCLDGIGVMIAGAREPEGLGRIVLEYTRQLGGKEQSSVIAGGFRTTSQNAAYANGTLCHALDWDNTWYPMNHPTSPTLPAILAIAERDHLPGADVLLAIVLAFEVQARVRVATASAPPGHGLVFHRPGVSGLIGSAAGAGKLLGLDVDQFCRAFGIAGSRAGGMSANTGTMTKSTHSGNAARMGIEAATLAKMGWTAHRDILDSGAFLELFFGHGKYDRELVVKDFGQPYWMIDPGVGFKKHPSNYHTHRPVDAAIDIATRYDLSLEEIESVEVDFMCFEHVDRPAPQTGLDAKFSIQYTTAAALLDRRITINTFSDERLFAPDIQSLLPRVRFNQKEEIPFDMDQTYAIVRVQTRDGRVLESRCDRPRGIWGVPLTRDERLAKFRDCAAPVLSERDMNELIDVVENLADLRDVTRLMEIASSAVG